MIGRVWEMLRLQAESVALLVHPSRLAGQRAVQKIAGVELDARLGGGHVEHASAGRFLEPCRVMQGRSCGPADRTVQHPVMVVAVAVLQLRMIGCDARA